MINNSIDELLPCRCDVVAKSLRSRREVVARAARAAVRQTVLKATWLLFTTLGARPPLNLDAIYYTWLRAPRRSVLNSIQVEGGAPPSVVNSSQVAGGAQPSVTNNSKEHPEGLQHRFSTAGHTAFPPNSYRPWAGVEVFIVCSEASANLLLFNFNLVEIWSFRANSAVRLGFPKATRWTGDPSNVCCGRAPSPS